MNLTPFTKLIIAALLPALFTVNVSGQSGGDGLSDLVESYRQDRRGPYSGIFWFCSDGSRRAARDPCPNDRHAVQHADYKPAVKGLMRNEHLFWGQILAGTRYTDFWDAENDHSRLKQYQLNNYLVAIDDGWILERARYYRGAFQVEDEEAWGRRFLRWLLRKDDALARHYYLITQAARDIPHGGGSDLTESIRAVSKEISDAYAPFMDLRIKIHGRPSVEDALAIDRFVRNHRDALDSLNVSARAEQLSRDIRRAYGGTGLDRISELLSALPSSDPLHPRIAALMKYHGGAGQDVSRLTTAADLSLSLRQSLVADDREADERLLLIDIGNELSDLVFRSADDWRPVTAREQMEKICYLGEAATGAGFVELWEQNQGGLLLGDPNYQYIHPWMLDEYLDNARRFVEWGAATNRATYGEVVERYAAFEPLAAGFLDHQIRGSVLLPLGRAVAELGDWLARNSDSGNALMDVGEQAQARGLNPGYTRGTLHVIEGSAEDIQVNNRDVYAFGRPPSDLKPVGGILSVSEGNMVSHVQLLARNLGLPNAVITDAQLSDLRPHDGEEVFYAVSADGTVVLKPATEMSDNETALFSEAAESERTRTTVPVDRLDLSTRRLLSLREVDSEDSGVRCGPKAANLGQLKTLFPNKVVEGLVIPFGVFREHLSQPMPGQPEGVSYWSFLNERFAEAKAMERRGATEAEVESYTLDQLSVLRQAIMDIELQPELIAGLREGFRDVLGGVLGEVPVFLRSDTNMEDLPEFTGAGLNKTVFNVVNDSAILAGIREVWASPYTERSYRWRQSYLSNPENVFPSILIIPSVDVDYSGVMITKGVTSGREDDITVAFSRGAGGAVDGQAAESYLLDSYGRFLLQAPARERMHRRLPQSGGSVMVPSAFDEAILSEKNLRDLYALGRKVERVIPATPGVKTDGPFDVELGFQDDNIYLFQIRPFVENTLAQGSEYLRSLDPPEREGVYIDLHSPMDAGRVDS